MVTVRLNSGPRGTSFFALSCELPRTPTEFATRNLLQCNDIRSFTMVL
jgi:hypothetical protein